MHSKAEVEKRLETMAAAARQAKDNAWSVRYALAHPDTDPQRPQIVVDRREVSPLLQTKR